MSSETLEALDPAGNGVRVVIEWRDDRFHHAIYGVQHGQPILLAESVEGDAVNAWPPSPPLQQLHKQKNESGEILFLTGMAGSSHWSGSVSTAVDPNGPAVKFDFACRHRTVPEWLGVAYQLGDGLAAEVVGDGVQMEVGVELKWGINAERVSVSDDELTIAAHLNSQGSSANTSRWEYTVRLSD